MCSIGSQPYALFVIAGGMSVEVQVIVKLSLSGGHTQLWLQTINSKLEQAWITDQRASWKLWLVTGNYDDAPKKRTDNRFNEGTAASIQSFPSPFAGKTIEDAAEWLENAPEFVDLNRMFFAVLNDRSESDDTITLCRIGDGGMEGKNGELQYFPTDARDAQIYLETMMAGAFDDRLQGYQRGQQMRGEPDLSKGEPWNGPERGSGE